MKRQLLIFGANGFLGRGVTDVLIEEDFKNIHLFDFKFDVKQSRPNLFQYLIKDLSIEENVVNAFSNIKVENDCYYFLYSTIGGFLGGKKLWETGVDDFERMISINLKANFLIAKHFSQIVKESSGGSICFTSAYVGGHPEKEKSVYGASKAAISHLVRTYSIEANQLKLSVNAIAPYVLDTPENRNWMKASDIEQAIKPEEIGKFVSAVFNNFNFISGNIFELKHRFNL